MGSETTKLAGGASHLAGIHALRGIAALMVFCFHLHYVGLIPLPKSWGLIASRGGLGVELFFVLSAFSLLYSNQKNVRSGDTSWILNYIIKRFFRIAPLFYAMLIVHCFLILYVFNGKLDIQRIIMSVLFIFNFAPKEAEGIVWASWSIGVEMVFYAFLPLIMVSVRSLRSAVVLWFVAVLASYIFRRVLEADSGIPPGSAHYAFMSQLGVFCGGILGYWSYVKIKSTTEVVRRKLLWLVVAIGPVAAILLLLDTSKFLVAPGRPDTQLWGLSFGFIAVLAAISAQKWMAHPVLQYFGERSYSIYLTHTVVIYFTGSLILQLYDFCYPTCGGYGFAVCALATLGFTLLVSEISYRYIEVPGITLGKHFYTVWSHRTNNQDYKKERTLKELIEIAKAAEKYALQVGVNPSIHLDDFIFLFLVDNQSFDCVDSAVKYYFYDGKKSATQLVNLIKESNRKEPVRTMLEFASGYGCVTRHLNEALPDVQSTACDIHAGAIRFIQEKLGAGAIISCDNPDDFNHPSRYDVVFALSFFSHMPRSTWGRWLAALYASVLPGGVLIFTTQGQLSAKYFGSPPLSADGYWFGSNSEQKDLDLANYGQTIVTEDFVRREIADKLNSKTFIFREGFWWGHQDCYVVRKPD